MQKRKVYTRLFRQYDVIHQRYNLAPGHLHTEEVYFMGRKRAGPTEEGTLEAYFR